jgi:type IV pilus assembly protein PilE
LPVIKKEVFMKKHSGFTLIELMVVVTVMSILMAIAVPQYIQYVQRSQLVEASSTLSDMRVRLEQFYQDNRTYDNTAAGVVAVAGPLGQTAGGPTCGVAAPAAGTTRYFTYTCDATRVGQTAGQAYLLTATGIAGQKTASFTFTLNEQNQRATTGTPAGWTSVALPAQCWLMSKGGSSC